ncbi:lipoate--protein ligase [Francisellaceae bacterium]|nr:lipoate--protein ligase [Francisellaceae bacterium]
MSHIYISQCNDPYLNLAFENWLFQNKAQEHPILFLWQNKPCIIIGRAQNPWLECDLTELEKDGVDVIRRQSGGGTVYHDLGNLNYTFICPNTHYDKQKNLQTVIDALSQLNIKAQISPRNDIIVKDKSGETRKVSGCAFRETKHKSFHHGTLLINADTSNLIRYLHHKQDQGIDAKGVASVRSKVINLSELNQNTDIKTYINALTLSFENNFSVEKSSEIKMIQANDIQHLSLEEDVKTLHSWEWQFGKTLPFEYTLQLQDTTLVLSVKKGHIQDSHLTQGQLSPTQEEWLKSQPRYTHNLPLENLT